MPTMQIRLPDFVQIHPRELLLTLAAKLYETGALSVGQAADVAGVSKRTFMELLGDYGVSVFNYDAQELERDCRNA